MADNQTKRGEGEPDDLERLIEGPHQAGPADSGINLTGGPISDFQLGVRVDDESAGPGDSTLRPSPVHDDVDSDFELPVRRSTEDRIDSDFDLDVPPLGDEELNEIDIELDEDPVEEQEPDELVMSSSSMELQVLPVEPPDPQGLESSGIRKFKDSDIRLLPPDPQGRESSGSRTFDDSDIRVLPRDTPDGALQQAASNWNIGEEPGVSSDSWVIEADPGPDHTATPESVRPESVRPESNRSELIGIIVGVVLMLILAYALLKGH
ncbi:MAG: hypothetical protein U0136_17050 [Bdellovibrionota bacterium]